MADFGIEQHLAHSDPSPAAISTQTPTSNILSTHGLSVGQVFRNLPPSVLYEQAIRYENDASIADTGALIAYSGEKTGRSPKDKRIVEHADSEGDVWWGAVNIPLDEPHLR